MALSPGTRIGPYEIAAAIGAGGMGEVYRAHDHKLNRDVAIKVLPPQAGGDRDRLSRFTREAQTLAALNHPNIAQVYDAGVVEGDATGAYIAMELVSGEDLSAHIARGPMPVAEVLAIARQLADALDTAHELGIVHRDLKPANIKLRADGTLKVLDFGLAKVVAGSEDPASNPSNSPTLTARATEAGIILGTAAYMSPEQAKGRVVDKRADIWAFGVILHEMLTGQPLFKADSVAETLGLIFSQEHNVAALPQNTPPALRALIARCLVKDPRRRLRDIGDAKAQLEDAIAGRGDASAPAVAGPTSTRTRPAWQLVVGALVLAGAALATGWFIKPAAPSPNVRLSITLLPGEQVTTQPAITVDGRLIAYGAGRTSASSQLFLRSLDDDTPRVVANSAGALHPFFSADGRVIAFFAGGKLRRASVSGGAATDLASAPGPPWGGTFDADGRIVFAPGLNAGLWRVSADGGTPEQLTKPDGASAGYAHVFPQRLPGTRDLLFAYWGQTFFDAVLSADSGTWRTVTTPTRALAGVGIYVPGDFLVGNDGSGNVAAIRWTPATTTPVAMLTPVLGQVHWVPSSEKSWIAVADNGTAVYVPGNPTRRHLALVDRSGNATVVPGEPAEISQASFSFDGQRILWGALRAQWIFDLTTGSRTRLISEFRAWHGAWLPGDSRIAFSSNKDGDWDLYSIPAAGGEITPLLKKPLTQHVQSVAPNGTIVYLERQPATGADLWTLAPDGTTTPLVMTRFNETSASVSADGRFVAYASDESGRNEVYVLPMSGKGDRTTVSVNGGTGPIWSRDGRELFYRAGDDLISVDVQTSGAAVLGARRKLLDLSAYDSGAFHEFDVSPDGKRFLLIRTDPESRPYRINVITNWTDELRKKVQ